MSCEKQQICNVCEKVFKMNKGCKLEKRCLGCRFLKLQKKPENEPIVFWMPEWLVSNTYVENTLEEDVMRIELKTKIINLLNILNEQEKTIIKLRYGLDGYIEPHDLKEISDIMDISIFDIARQLNTALKKLKHPRLNKNLKSYLDKGI